MHHDEVYEIRVVGELGGQWSQRLGDMSLTAERSAEGKTVTKLVGRLRDQAALSGVLETLYELHLPVLTLRRLPNGGDQPHEEAP
jgi:hypothetical protein